MTVDGPLPAAPGAARRAVRDRLAAAGTPSPDVDADRLLDHVTGRGRLERLTRPRDLTDAERTDLAALTAARASGTPLQHLTGEADFHGLTLMAGPGALVPRPETEVLVERALAVLQGRPAPVVLDVGTGSGAIAVALQVARPDAEVWASDASADALAVAERNVHLHAPAVHLVHGAGAQPPALRALLPRLDLLAANLPYLPDGGRAAPAAEVAHDPADALYGGPDGLDVVRAVWREVETELAPHAVGLFEVDPRNADAFATWLAARPAVRGRSVAVHPDLTGRPRLVEVGAREEAGAPGA